MLRTLFVLVTFLCANSISWSQNSDDAAPVTKTFYISNATVIQSPDKQMENASIIIRDGIISEIGKSIKVPFDAQVIDADSMYVYPGFINAATHTGYKDPETKVEKAKDPGNPTFQQAGITPDISLRDVYDSKDGLKGLREVGYGYAQVFPQGKMLPGKGSILTTGTGDFSHNVLKEDVAVLAQMKSSRGVYPNTVLGLMTRFRELFKNAALLAKDKRKYALNPQGLKRPVEHREMEALMASAQGKQPVYFNATSIKNILRAIKLKNELGLNMTLVGLQNSTPILSKIKQSGCPVVVSLKLPKEPKAPDSTKATAEEKKLYARQKEAYMSAINQAQSFVKSGVPISFSSIGTKDGDIVKNLRKMVANGLSERDALAAMTVQPAQLLGIDKVAGTLEKGKLANLFMTDAPYFGEKSKLMYSFTDGVLYDLSSKKKGGKDNLEDVVGKWKYDIIIPGMTESGVIDISKEGEEYVVKVSSDSSPGDFSEATDVTVDDKTISFNLSISREGMNLSLDYELTFDGSTMEGTVDTGQFGSFPAEGKKINSPE